jgi:hypothetical protein
MRSVIALKETFVLKQVTYFSLERKGTKAIIHNQNPSITSEEIEVREVIGPA